MQNIFKWNALCWTNTIIFVFIFESNGQFMSYKFVGAQINQLTLFSKKTTKNRQVQIWSNLINSDQFWSKLIKSDQNLFLIKFDQIWSDLYFYIFLKNIYPVVLFKTETNRFMLLLFFFWHLPGLRLKGMFNLLLVQKKINIFAWFFRLQIKFLLCECLCVLSCSNQTCLFFEETVSNWIWWSPEF